MFPPRVDMFLSRTVSTAGGFRGLEVRYVPVVVLFLQFRMNEATFAIMNKKLINSAKVSASLFTASSSCVNKYKSTLF